MRKQVWIYLKGFLLAVLIEIIALASLIPGLAMIGTRHTANAPPNDIVLLSERIGFVMHLPTILLTWPFKDSTVPIIFLTPATQILFFTLLFVFISKRRR